MRSLAIACLALVAAGCPKGVQYPECRTDQDCSSHGEVCLNGFCKQCRDDSNCAAFPDRPLCRDAICVAKPECTRNEDCGTGRKCAQNRCVMECSSDADCPKGRPCQGGVCAPPRVEKRSAADCGLKPVYFAFDDASLSPGARQALDEEFQCLRAADFGRLLLAGHADERGTTEYNLALGERRAESVRRYLVQLGAEASKLNTTSYGEERPAVRGHDESAWAKNRRVELTPEP